MFAALMVRVFNQTLAIALVDGQVQFVPYLFVAVSMLHLLWHAVEMVLVFSRIIVPALLGMLEHDASCQFALDYLRPIQVYALTKMVIAFCQILVFARLGMLVPIVLCHYAMV